MYHHYYFKWNGSQICAKLSASYGKHSAWIPIYFFNYFIFISSRLWYPLTRLNLLQVFYDLIPSLIRNIMQPRIPVPLLGEYYSKDSKTSMFWQDSRFNQWKNDVTFNVKIFKIIYMIAIFWENNSLKMKNSKIRPAGP